MPELHRPTALLAIALTIGLFAERLLYGRTPGLAVPIMVALLLLALAWVAHGEERPANPANLWVGGAALLFAGLVAVRASPLLTLLNLLAVGGLLLLQVTLYRAESLARLDAWRVSAGALLAGVEAALVPAPLTVSAFRRMGGLSVHARGALVLVRGSLLAAPVLLVFTGLLAMADGVFASYVGDLARLRLPFDLAELTWRLIWSLVIAWGVAGAMLIALREHPLGSLLGPRPAVRLPAEGETQPLSPGSPLRVLGFGEALVVLLLVNGLFAVFMLIQGAYLFGGLDTLARTGLSFAEYARRGFFELVAVAVLSLGLLWGLATLTRRSEPWQAQAFVGASAAMIGLVLGMLGSAALRMWLYEQAYGFTLLRLLTHSWMLWLATVLLLFLAALLYDRPRWFSLGLPAAAACYLLALNLLSPEAMIVRENLARYAVTGDLDSAYLMTLSPDATPAIVAALPQLGPVGEPLRTHLTHQRTRLAAEATRDGWPAWNLGRVRALAAK
jgi:hypothetical protein